MLSQITLTILCENRVVNPKLTAEQGLSILVESPEGSLLFDTGQTDTVLSNAGHLNIDLNRINKIVLSHGHFDMTGGLQYVMRELPQATVYCHPNLFNKKFKIMDDERVEIGVPWEKSELENMGVRFILKTRPLEVLPGIWISGEIPRLTDYETIDETYQERILESYIHDDLHDDMALIIKTTKGLIILLGCGHSGAVNTVKHAMRIMGQNRVHLIMGGMHLHQAAEERIVQVVNHLTALNPDFIAPLHCCGFRCINLLFNQLNERIKLMNVGDKFTLNA